MMATTSLSLSVSVSLFLSVSLSVSLSFPLYLLSIYLFLYLFFFFLFLELLCSDLRRRQLTGLSFTPFSFRISRLSPAPVSIFFSSFSLSASSSNPSPSSAFLPTVFCLSRILFPEHILLSFSCLLLLSSSSPHLLLVHYTERRAAQGYDVTYRCVCQWRGNERQIV